MIKTAIIEDSQALISVYKRFLADTGFSVHVFNSTKSDINRLIKENGFKIIVCPCFPKYQDGPAIVQAIKAVPDLGNAVFILSTSMQKERIPSEWDPRDIDTILLKPFDSEGLEKALSKASATLRLHMREIPLALVIDDSRAVRNTLASFLKPMNFEVKTASDGEEGLRIADDNHPDLILVDVEMPVMDGFEFCRHLAQRPQLKHTPVIVISGVINESQFRKGFSAGAVDFLQKPVSQTDLATIIESVSVKSPTRSSGTTVILSQDPTLCAILNKTLNFLKSSIHIYERLEELETYLNLSNPDIIILDLSFYDEKLDICMRVRQAAGNDSSVIIAIAGESDRDIMFQCFKFGATEFLIKPFGRDEVRARIENHIKLKALQDELVRKNKILESLAYKDKLTGLMNRRYFDKALADESRRAQKKGNFLSFTIMDLDNFKQVNDRYGHDTGDEVLKVIAAIVRENVPDSAVPCRYGGEEFCIIYPDTDLVTATRYSEKIKRFCSAGRISKHRIYQTVSGGVSCFPQTSGVETLVADADQCLYKAKEAGKNRIIAKVPLSETP